MVVPSFFHTLAHNWPAPFIDEINASASGADVHSFVDNVQTSS